MPPLTIILLLILPLLLVAAAAFAGVETALFSLTQADRLRIRKTSPRLHHQVGVLLSSPRGLLVSVLLANTTINTAYFAVAAVVASSFDNAAWEVGFSIAALLALVVGAEVMPKSLASLHRERTCRLLCGPLLWWHLGIGPLRRTTEVLIAAITRLFRPAGKSEASDLSAEELTALLEVGGRQGVLDAGEQRLLNDVVKLGEVRVKDVMTPRVSMQWLDAGSTLQDLLAIVKETGHDTFPLCRGALDEETIVGVITTQRALPHLNKHGHDSKLPLLPMARPAQYIPDRARLDQLLDHFRTTHSDTAFCVNELGDLTGMVEMDGVIGKLVSVSSGEAAAEEEVRMTGLGVWEVPGRLPIRDWGEFFGPRDIEVDGGVSTVAGLMMARLGHVPHVGESTTIRNLRLTVAAMSGRLIEKVTVTLTPMPGDGPPRPDVVADAQEAV